MSEKTSEIATIALILSGAITLYVLKDKIFKLLGWANAEPTPNPEPEPDPEPEPNPDPNQPDTTIPVLYITEPEKDSVVKASGFSVKGTATDSQSGIKIVEIRSLNPLNNEGTNWRPVSSVNAYTNWSHNMVVNTPAHTDIQVRAIDNAGNIAYKRVSVTYQTVETETPAPEFIPGTEILYPADNVVYHENPVYPVTAESVQDMIRQAFIDSRYYRLIQNQAEVGNITFEEFYRMFKFPQTWLKNHPNLGVTYPTYFRTIAI
jgi:hypothetical protein